MWIHLPDFGRLATVEPNLTARAPIQHSAAATDRPRLDRLVAPDASLTASPVDGEAGAGVVRRGPERAAAVDSHHPCGSADDQKRIMMGQVTDVRGVAMVPPI